MHASPHVGWLGLAGWLHWFRLHVVAIYCFIDLSITVVIVPLNIMPKARDGEAGMEKRKKKGTGKEGGKNRTVKKEKRRARRENRRNRKKEKRKQGKREKRKAETKQKKREKRKEGKSKTKKSPRHRPSAAVDPSTHSSGRMQAQMAMAMAMLPLLVKIMLPLRHSMVKTKTTR